MSPPWWQLPSATSATQSGELVMPKAMVPHGELQPDCRDMGVPARGRWLSRSPRGWRAPPALPPAPPSPPLCPAVSQIVTQDYCEAVQQLELEQDLRLHAEAFAHEVRPGPGPPCPWVLGGEQAPTGGGRAGGLLVFSANIPIFIEPLRPGPREGGDAPEHPSRSPGMRWDGVLLPAKGFLSPGRARGLRPP